MEITEPVVIVFHEKHSDRYFLAKSQNDLECIATKIVLERYAEGWWYYFSSQNSIPPKPKIELVDATPEKVGDNVAKAILREWKDYNYAVAEYNRGQKEKQLLEQIKEGHNDPKMRTKAWQFLKSRNGYEYENFDIEYFEEYRTFNL